MIRACTVVWVFLVHVGVCLCVRVCGGVVLCRARLEDEVGVEEREDTTWDYQMPSAKSGSSRYFPRETPRTLQLPPWLQLWALAPPPPICSVTELGWCGL